VSAVVSDAPPGPIALTRTNIRAHADAIQELLETATAVVPLKFGTVFPDEEAIRQDLLCERGDGLARLLRRVENRVEFRLKAFYVEESVLREVVHENPAIADLNRRTRVVSADAAYYDSIQLGELVASALAAKRAKDTNAIMSRLAPLATAHLIEDEPYGEWNVATASFLVDRSGASRFDDALADLAEDSQGRIRFRCVGPLAPYSFVDTGFLPGGGA
jgi:hypothetical protein